MPTLPSTLRRALRVALAAVLALVSARPAAAQLRGVHLTLDNDAYDFWVPMDVRPDEEYTNGMEVALDLAGAPGPLRRLAPRLPACGGAETPAQECTATTAALGHKIFTPRVDATPLPAGERPYAGWLYASATTRLSKASRLRAAGVEVGVTGPPSGGEVVHETFHRIIGFWQPRGWSGQVPFEPGAVVRYDEAYMAADVRVGGVRVATLAPAWGAALGNVLTGAHAGLDLRLGHTVPHPWNEAADRGAGPVSAYVLARARGDAVARNLFLDGSTFGGGPGVERIPFVGRWELGAGVRYEGFTFEFRTLSRSREYRTEPRGHTYSTFALSYRLR
ncbi:MAG TPA: lipid A deacylase LpxR family protein [Longimicrobium sp.]|nr:lipid A deacylase LpxR family protein [Longimicrobium sp.]